MRDFTAIFDAYAQFEESVISAKMQQEEEDEEDEEDDEEEDMDVEGNDMDLRLARLEVSLRYYYYKLGVEYIVG